MLIILRFKILSSFFSLNKSRITSLVSLFSPKLALGIPHPGWGKRFSNVLRGLVLGAENAAGRGGERRGIAGWPTELWVLGTEGNKLWGGDTNNCFSALKWENFSDILLQVSHRSPTGFNLAIPAKAGIHFISITCVQFLSFRLPDRPQGQALIKP